MAPGGVVLNATMIVVSEITDDTITLRHVSPEFVRAYREMARGGIDSERTARKPSRRPGGRRPTLDAEVHKVSTREKPLSGFIHIEQFESTGAEPGRVR